MKKVALALILLPFLIVPFTAFADEGIPLQKDVYLGAPIYGPEDLPEEITFTLYDSPTASVPLGYQTFTRGQYTVDFEFSKSDGISSGNVARLSADFTNTLNLKDAEGEAIQPKEIWAALEVGGAEIGDRSKVSDGTMVQLLLASDASIATYLTLAYTGDENPITTIYKDLPISSLSSDGSVSSLSNYFRGITTAASEGLIEPNATIGNIGDDGIFGTVGIGTASPETKLHIRNGDVLLSNGQSYFIKNTTGTNVKVMGLSPSNNITIGNTSVNDMNLYGGSGRLRFHTSAVSPFMTALNNGNVGINTASPETKLHIRNGDVLLSNGQSYFIENTTGTNVKVMGLSPSNNITIGNTSVNDMNLYGGSGNLRFHTSAVSPFMAALNNGNVGIGTTNPGAYKLAVDGTIGCRELVVTTAAWADFVFGDDYRLPPLDEVEKFISENKHLPGIPSQGEVEEKGVRIGDINSKFLQKIEELTLYLIELKKKNELLQAQIVSIQKHLKNVGDGQRGE